MNSLLSPRLCSIADMVKDGAAVIDVGTDHAYIPIFLLKENKAVKALATDINEGPLKRAEQNIDLYNLSQKIAVRKANGLIGIKTTEYDTIIIAGMGGMLIAEILEGADDLSNMELILQPMTASDELRRYLNTNGYLIREERIVQEDKKLYVILKAVRGEEKPYTDIELLLGRQSEKEPLYLHLKAQIIEKLEKRYFGLRNAQTADEEEIKRVNTILKELRA